MYSQELFACGLRSINHQQILQKARAEKMILDRRQPVGRFRMTGSHVVEEAFAMVYEGCAHRTIPGDASIRRVVRDLREPVLGIAPGINHARV